MGYKIPVLTGQERFILTVLLRSLHLKNYKTVTAGPVFCSLGPVWLQSFSSHETGLPNTSVTHCQLTISLANSRYIT
jgi:hypothetical protein